MCCFWFFTSVPVLQRTFDQYYGLSNIFWSFLINCETKVLLLSFWSHPPNLSLQLTMFSSAYVFQASQQFPWWFTVCCFFETWPDDPHFPKFWSCICWTRPSRVRSNTWPSCCWVLSWCIHRESLPKLLMVVLYSRRQAAVARWRIGKRNQTGARCICRHFFRDPRESSCSFSRTIVINGYIIYHSPIVADKSSSDKCTPYIHKLNS